METASWIFPLIPGRRTDRPDQSAGSNAAPEPRGTKADPAAILLRKNTKRNGADAQYHAGADIPAGKKIAGIDAPAADRRLITACINGAKINDI